MRKGFIVDISDCRIGNEITKVVLKKSYEVANQLPDPNKAKGDRTYKVSITFYQSKDRWRPYDKTIPREDRGDLDNLTKMIFDGLGPIIGFRKQWDTGEPVNSERRMDSRILELTAKKVNSGSDKEMVSVEIETLA